MGHKNKLDFLDGIDSNNINNLNINLDDLADLDVNNLEDNDISENDYFLLQESVTLMSATTISIKDSTEITNHILLCGIHPSIYYFILPLRAKYLKEWQHIVILSEEPPT